MTYIQNEIDVLNDIHSKLNYGLNDTHSKLNYDLNDYSKLN